MVQEPIRENRITPVDRQTVPATKVDKNILDDGLPLRPGACKEMGSLKFRLVAPVGLQRWLRLSSRVIKSAGAFQTANIH